MTITDAHRIGLLAGWAAMFEDLELAEAEQRASEKLNGGSVSIGGSMCLLIRYQIRSEISSPHLRLTLGGLIDPPKRTPKTPKRQIGAL